MHLQRNAYGHVINHTTSLNPRIADMHFETHSQNTIVCGCIYKNHTITQQKFSHSTPPTTHTIANRPPQTNNISHPAHEWNETYEKTILYMAWVGGLLDIQTWIIHPRWTHAITNNTNADAHTPKPLLQPPPSHAWCLIRSLMLSGLHVSRRSSKTRRSTYLWPDRLAYSVCLGAHFIYLIYFSALRDATTQRFFGVGPNATYSRNGKSLSLFVVGVRLCVLCVCVSVCSIDPHGQTI